MTDMTGPRPGLQDANDGVVAFGAGDRSAVRSIDDAKVGTWLRAVAATKIGNRAFGDRKALREAERMLQLALKRDPADRGGETYHLLGVVHFHLEAWDPACEHLNIALTRAPENANAEALLAMARVNAMTRVHEPVCARPGFTADEVLALPALELREPQGLEPLPPPSRAGRLSPLRHWLHQVLGLLADQVVSIAYDGRDTTVRYAFDSWDRRSTHWGALELAGIRRELNGDKLHSTYHGLVGDQPPCQRRPAWTERFRTATGAWTTDDPMEGAAGTEFQRTGWPASHPRRRNRAEDADLPSAREVSRELLLSRGSRQTVPFLNLLTSAWIQSQVHDWLSHRVALKEQPYKVRLAPDDPLRATHCIDALHVRRSAPTPLPGRGDIAYLNEVTHWWDASHLYGSDQATQDRLRGFDGRAFLPDGKLLLENGLLPRDGATGVELTGFMCNWWVGLSLFHTLFARHHNFICDVLRRAHPAWSSDQLFHTARMVNAAILAKIHTVEWTPAVLPNRKVVIGMAANWWGLIEAKFRPFGERQIRRDDEILHEVLGGIVGGACSNHGKPFGLTEEFSEIYRLHAALPDAVKLTAIGATEPSGEVPTDATRGAMARRLLERHGLGALLNSFGHQHMPALVHNNYPAFAGAMSVEGQPVVDLGTIDILRARERGVPAYNDFRRMLGLEPLARFDDLRCDAATVAALERLYGDIEKMDLLVGTSCELHRPNGFGFGETMFTVFIQMASRRLHADPFYTEKLNERYYTREGMDLIERATLKDILLQHCPELAATGLSRVDNAFEPWGTSAGACPDEHPLSRIERYR